MDAPVRTGKDLSTFLARHGVPHEIVDPGRPTPTCAAAAEALGTTVDRIVKSVLFVTDRGDRLLCVLRGDDRADASKLREATGATGWRLARPAEVLAATGYAIGAVPPFVIPPHAVGVLVDARVAAEDEVVGGGGAGHLLLRCPAEAIVRVNGARVVPLAGSTPA